MKNTIRNLGSLTLLGMMLVSKISSAQSTADSSSTTTTTTNSAGTISEFSPDSIVVKTTTSADPITYSYTKATTYVDADGNPVAVDTVKSGLPVTVYYTSDGDKMIATRVVVSKAVVVDPAVPVPSESAITTSAGTVTEFSPDAIVVRTTTSAEPISYESTKTTSYVDEDGNTVSSETVKSGLPVTVYYDMDGNKMVATKVIVRKSTSTTTAPANP